MTNPVGVRYSSPQGIAGIIGGYGRRSHGNYSITLYDLQKSGFCLALHTTSGLHIPRARITSVDDDFSTIDFWRAIVPVLFPDEHDAAQVGPDVEAAINQHFVVEIEVKDGKAVAVKSESLGQIWPPTDSRLLPD